MKIFGIPFPAVDLSTCYLARQPLNHATHAARPAATTLSARIVGNCGADTPDRNKSERRVAPEPAPAISVFSKQQKEGRQFLIQ